MYPEKTTNPMGGNSLACWGKHLGFEKMDYDGGWDTCSDEMIKYCIQDVEVSHRIFLAQQGFIAKYNKQVTLEHIVTDIIATQIDNGFSFDLNEALDLEMMLSEEKAEIEDTLRKVFPTIVEERISEKTGKRLKDKVTVFNPGSRQQIAERLGDKYGWKPPLTDKGNPKVDSQVLKKLEYPEAEALARYFDITKMQSQVSDWLIRSVSSRDGKIHGSVNPQGTVTGRMTASQPNLQQVHSDKRMRSLFIPSPGKVMVGIDASGLEARMLASRMAKYDDGEYADVILTKDIHDYNMEQAGLNDRDVSKTFFYGFIYGAGNDKISKITKRNGKRLKEKFLENMPALKKAIDDVKWQVAKKKTITLLDGREVPCRSEHAALNVQLQGDGAIVMKLAQAILYTKIKDTEGVKFLATVHDEWQLECRPEVANEVGKAGVEAIRDAGVRLGVQMPLDGEYKIGNNWSETH
jgi:DNA polymerase I-like protein with 3'-5' exonuclease and polymerase domains